MEFETGSHLEDQYDSLVRLHVCLEPHWDHFIFSKKKYKNVCNSCACAVLCCEQEPEEPKNATHLPESSEDRQLTHSSPNSVNCMLLRRLVVEDNVSNLEMMKSMEMYRKKNQVRP